MGTLLLRRNRNYRLLFTGSAFSNLGDGIGVLAFPWLATMISRDPFHIALVAFATSLPWLLFALPVGVVIDRAERQKVMVRADVFRLLLCMGAVGLILAGPELPLPDTSSGTGVMILTLAGIAFLLGTAEVFRDNAAQTVMPSVVEKGDLEQANGQMWSMEQVMGSFVGPPLAGVLIALAVPAPFIVEAAAFGIAAWCVWSMVFPARVRVAPRRSFWQEFREGFAWLLGHGVLLRLAVMLGLMNFLNTMAFTILVLYAQEVLELSALGFGMLLMASAGGAVIGGLVAPALIKRLGGNVSLHVSLFTYAFPYLILAVSGSAILAGAALFIQMIFVMLWNVVTVSYRQRVIPDELLGRVNSI